MEAPKRIVYVLKNDATPLRYYTGLTSNLAARLDAHANALSAHWDADVTPFSFRSTAASCLSHGRIWFHVRSLKMTAYGSPDLR